MELAKLMADVEIVPDAFVSSGAAQCAGVDEVTPISDAEGEAKFEQANH